MCRALVTLRDRSQGGGLPKPLKRSVGGGADPVRTAVNHSRDVGHAAVVQVAGDDHTALDGAERLECLREIQREVGGLVWNRPLRELGVGRSPVLLRRLPETKTWNNVLWA